MRPGSAWLLLFTLAACSDGTAPIGHVGGSRFAVEPFLRRPFHGAYPVTNVFDHDLPLSWDDRNGRVLAWWGETIEALDGHMGYDWVMPEGTPLLAAASGIVTRAGLGSEQYCPPLGRSTRNGSVVVLHETPEGDRFAIAYAHVSRAEVSVGDVVVPGQVLALSGNTGCSTGPHLHFQIEYQSRAQAPVTTGGVGVPAVRGIAVDPFGWAGDGPDPWSENPWGAESSWLWLEPPSAPGAR